MARDDVLRCKLHCTLEKTTQWIQIDAIEAGDCYALVLEWACKEGEETEFPKKQIGITKDKFRTVSDPLSPYELECLVSINLDDIIFPQSSRDAEEIWMCSDNLFYPRPDEDDS